LIKKRREILFLYRVKDANPNGDPLNENQPRFDDDTGQALSSDVRIKRTVRDEWQREGRDVFVDGQSKSLSQKAQELAKKFPGADRASQLKHCIDVRAFGVVFALQKESLSWTGPVQFKWGRSLHRVRVVFVQGNSAFATKDDTNRSLRSEFIVPFALMGTSAIVNQAASKGTGMEESDVQALRDGLWNGTRNLVTRSKMEHSPVLLLEIVYKEGVMNHLGSLDEKVRLVSPQGNPLGDDEQLALRSLQECSLDFSEFNRSIQRVEEWIEEIRVVACPEVTFSQPPCWRGKECDVQLR